MSSTRSGAMERLHEWLARGGTPLSVADGVAMESTAVHDPATGQTLACFRETSADELDGIIAAASAAQTKWNVVPPLERSKLLRQAAALVRRDCDWLAELETLDTGKPFWEALEDVRACADSLELFAGFAPTLAGTHVPVPPDPASFYYTRREPFGVCAGIGAWNFPFQMAVWKSAPALAAGNALVFKPSPLTPLSAVRLSQLFVEAGLPAGLFAVVLGGIPVGQALVSHPSVAKVSFTGSVAGGRAVLSAAARKVIPGTVELGGKSALIVMSDADVDEAVKGALMANLYTQGQVCSNAARVFVHSQLFDCFTQKLVAAVDRLRVGDPFKADTCIGALITPEHKARVMGFVRDAVAEGARVLCGEELTGNFMKPYILTDCHDAMTVVKEEVFGPVITLLKFDTEEEAIQRANNSELGLAGGVFTRDLACAHRVAARLQCGSVYVNSYNAYPPGIPFGGYKQSGFGRENSLDTLLSYTQLKAVYVEGARLPEPFP